MFRIAKLTALAGVIALATLPAAAGPYEIQADVITGARASGQGFDLLQRPFTFGLESFQADGASARGSIRVLPLPTDSEAAQDAPETGGCIKVVGPGGTDASCKIESAFVDFDPLMNKGSIVVTWESAKYDGLDLRATIALTGQGVPAPTTEGGSPTVTPAKAAFDGRVVIARDAVIDGGIIVSEGLNLSGAIVSTTAARMFTGLAIDAVGGTECTVQTGGVCQN